MVSNIQISQLVSAIQFYLRPEAGFVRDKAGGGKAGAARRDVRTEAASRPDAGRMAARVQAIEASDPDRGRKVFRIFLESVLLEQLGRDLINDPAFYDLVDQVQDCMEAEPFLQEKISRAICQLIGE